MSDFEADIVDLIVRSRQGQLRGAEQRRLNTALMHSRELRLLYEAGVGFDDQSSVQMGDERLIEELARRAVPQPVRPRRKRKRLVGWLAAGGVTAAAVTATAAAVTSWWGTGELSESVSTPSSSHPPEASGAESRQGPGVADEPSAPSVTPEVASSERVAKAEADQETSAGTEREANTREAARISSEPPKPLSASELFARANKARRERDASGARELYSKLQRLHPQSSEALHAHLTLARLELMGGQPKAALRSAQSYEQGGGRLLAEAWWTRAEALRALGRQQERRHILKRLAERFPRSSYARAARQQLDE